jgi:hypothetical protein
MGLGKASMLRQLPEQADSEQPLWIHNKVEFLPRSNGLPVISIQMLRSGYSQALPIILHPQMDIASLPRVLDAVAVGLALVIEIAISFAPWKMVLSAMVLLDKLSGIRFLFPGCNYSRHYENSMTT